MTQLIHAQVKSTLCAFHCEDTFWAMKIYISYSFDFRISVAAEMGMYDFIDTIYSATNISGKISIFSFHFTLGNCWGFCINTVDSFTKASPQTNVFLAHWPSSVSFRMVRWKLQQWSKSLDEYASFNKVLLSYLYEDSHSAWTCLCGST